MWMWLIEVNKRDFLFSLKWVLIEILWKKTNKTSKGKNSIKDSVNWAMYFLQFTGKQRIMPSLNA